MKDMLSDICSFFILHPSAFILAFGGRCGSRTHRSVSAPTVFGTAWRARAQPSFVLAGALGFEPRKAGLESASLTFSLRPLEMHQGGLEPPKLSSEPQLYRLLPCRFGL